MKKTLVFLLLALLVLGVSIQIYTWKKSSEMALEQDAQDRKYSLMSSRRISEIGDATYQFPSSIMELATDVPDPGYTKWLIENSGRISMPLMGQSYPDADTKLIAFDLKPRSGRSGKERVAFSVGGAAKILE